MNRYRAITGLASVEKNKKIIDCACGTGKGSRLILKNLSPSRFVCVDIDKKQLEKCRKITGNEAEYICSDLCDLVLNEKFNYFFCMETLEHLEEEDNERVASVITDLIEKGGMLLISVPRERDTLKNHSKHKQVITKEKLLSLFVYTAEFMFEAEAKISLKRSFDNLYIFRKKRI